MEYLDQNFHTYLSNYCPATGMQNGDVEGLPRISMAG